MNSIRLVGAAFLIFTFIAPVGIAQDVASEMVKAPQLMIPPSKLINLNHPKRIPNAYIVVFKNDDDLAKQVPSSVATQLTVAPGLLPTSEESITRIGLEMAGRFRSKALVSVGDDGRDLHRIRHVFSKALRGFSLDAVSENDIANLAKDPRVEYVEAVLRGHSTALQTEMYAPWDLDRLEQPRGLTGTYRYSATGAGVTVWILDTGVQFSHNEFNGRAGGYSVGFVQCGAGQDCSTYYKVCTNQDCSGAVSWYYPSIKTNASTADNCGHGTAVGSVVDGTVSGVAKGALVIGVNVTFAGCEFRTDVIIAGLDYVINHKVSNTNIINMSIEVAVGDQWNPSFENAVAAAVNAGIVFITAAGNEEANACNYDPGRLPYVITVGASSPQDLVSSYSNYGPCITLFAPGDGVTAADNGYDSFFTQPQAPTGSNAVVNTIYGTSFSAPIVAGIAALYLQNNPGASPATVKQAITSTAWLGKLQDTRSGVVGSPNLLASPCVPGNAVCTGAGGSGGGGSNNRAAVVLTAVESLLP
jgi:subtilisin family serine protease